MRHSISNEHPQVWDDGTYQTGAPAREKHSSALVAGLLAGVILLGGLASALGVMNIRLLSKLKQHNAEAIPVGFRAAPADSNALDSFLQTDDIPLPRLPEDGALRLELQETPKQASTQSMKAQDVLSSNEDSLVTITCDAHAHPQHRGIGVIVSENGYILTNLSATSHANRIFVKLSDGRVFRAAVVGTDDFTDLAVLYVEAEGLQPARLGYAANLSAGETVYGIADAVTMEPTQGEIVSEAIANSLLQSTVSSDFGPVFSRWGQMIGFHVGQVARYYDREQSEGLTLTAERLTELVSQLTAGGRVAGRPCLGLKVQAVSKLYQQYWNLPDGLQVTEVTQDCGLQIGDILMELNGRKLCQREDLIAILHDSQPGDTYTATVYRNGQQFTTTLTVTETP